jgi:LysM repeat protein
VADDPGDKAASRSRRRRAGHEAGPDASAAPIDAAKADAAPIEPTQVSDDAPPPAPIGDRPLPTFLHAGPGVDGLADALSDADRGSETVTAESRYAADRILDGWAENLVAPAAPTAVEPATLVEPSPVVAPTAPSQVVAPPAPSPVDHSWLPILEDRSPDPETCPFLRAADAADRLVAPVETPDPANRCAALRDAVPQSLRQQELVCLSSGHVNCPRYLRGAVVIAEAPEPAVRRGRSLTPAVLGSLVVLVMAASASVAFVMARGGLELAAAVPTLPPVASATAVAQAPVTPVPTVAPTAIPTPIPTPIPTASPSPTPSPTPRATAKPTTQPTTGTASRYAVLRPCPDTPRCWIYRVRAGDNLYSIAHWFGVSIDSIYARNPWTRTQGLRAGQELRLPPPTR